MEASLSKIFQRVRENKCETIVVQDLKAMKAMLGEAALNEALQKFLNLAPEIRACEEQYAQLQAMHQARSRA